MYWLNTMLRCCAVVLASSLGSPIHHCELLNLMYTKHIVEHELQCTVHVIWSEQVWKHWTNSCELTLVPY